MSIFKRLIKYIFSLQNLFIYRSVKKEEIIAFLKLFKIKIPSNINFIRIGPDSDGGYVVPDILKEIDYCFSAGVGNNNKFEKDLYNFNIKSFGADHSIDGPPDFVKDYSFIKKNINLYNDDKNITFEKWVKDQNIPNDNLIGQIDIEGNEYKLILSTPSDIFKKFKILIFEFHYIHKINEKVIYDFYFDSLKKILMDFNICHIHINNAEKDTKIRDIKIPHLLEVTFLRKDFYNTECKEVIIPNILDKKNIPNNQDVNFDKNWIEIIT